ncbi:hypothetical protein [Flavobacterium piscinae]|uniref:hypothetical protein n=1 Tax=Flavobacterium piscinae TaxID=2506424 RepID=UPI002AAAF6FA|nr:hypothetical protein [Flavobacterium piscinae]
MNKNGYDHCHVGDYQFDYPAGIENLKNKLVAEFPQEAKNIREYLSLIEKVNYELQLIPKLKDFGKKSQFLFARNILESLHYFH